MIIETILENGLVRSQSDIGLKIRNEQTGGEYDYADDLPNEIRIKQGLQPYSYVEVERVEDIEVEEGEYYENN